MDETLFQELLQSVEEIKAIRRGELEPARVTRIDFPDVAEVRADMGLTQSEFAALLGISVRTLQDWEQGRRFPRGPARALILVARHDPETVLKAIYGEPAESTLRRARRDRPRRERRRRREA
jgi:putative transcriptional regulator